MLLNPFIGTSAVGAGGGGPTYLFEERFEGTGYENTWIETGTGTINEDYTPALEGSQSLRIAASAQTPDTTCQDFADQTELWGFFRVRMNVLPSASRSLFRLRGPGGTAGTIRFTASNQINAQHGTANASSTDAMTTGVDYYLWWHWKMSTGTNGILAVGFSASSTEVTGGTSFVSETAGTFTTAVTDIGVGTAGTSTTYEFIIDQILVSNTGTIGSNPA